VRFLTHVFRAENPDVLCESLSTGRRLLKWLESQRIKRTLCETRDATAAGISAYRDRHGVMALVQLTKAGNVAAASRLDKLGILVWVGALCTPPPRATVHVRTILASITCQEHRMELEW